MTTIGTGTLPTVADQLVYTWAPTGLDGARGFGIAGISDGLRDRVPAIKAQLKDLGRFDPRASESPDGLRSYRHFERRVIGEITYLISKTCQGQTADGRGGNFCAQVLVASKTELTASLCVALSRASLWIRPYDTAADLTAAQLPAVELGSGDPGEFGDISDSEPAGSGETGKSGHGSLVLRLLREAVPHGWSLSMDDVDLDGVRQVLGVLPAAADVDTTFVFETDAGSTSLTVSLDFGSGATPSNHRGRLASGDAAWQQLRTRLSTSPSPERARTMFDLYYPSGSRPTSTTRKMPAAGETGARHMQQADRELPEVHAYLRGDAAALASMLEPDSAGGLELCLGVMRYLRTNSSRLSCSTAAATELSAQLLACSEPHLDAAEIDQLMPRDGDALHRLANHLISPAILRGLARSEPAAPPRSGVCPEFVTMPDKLWPTLRTLWASTAAHAPLIQVLQPGAASIGSLFRTLMAAEPVDAEFLFEQLFPALWESEDEAAHVLYSVCWTQYVEWSGTPAYYAGVLSHRRRQRWFPVLRRRAR